jgi:fibronectin-binding autotransporter adhesin
MNSRILSLAFVLTLLLLPRAFGAPTILYYDTNGATGGTSTSSTQNFTDSVWTLDPFGLTTTTGYTAGSDIVFSADDGVNVGTGTQSVTVQDAESADGFIFDNGIVTLYGSGGPNLSLGAGGVTVNSNDGATTFDSSLGTVTLAASQLWTQNSSQALNVNSNVAGTGNTLTLAGIGTGNVNLSGVLSGALNLTATSATDTVYLNNTGNNFSGTITADGGAIVAEHQSTLGGNSITLENGGLLEMNDTQGYGGWNNTINLGTGGGQIYAGTAAGGGIDIVYSGYIGGGTGLSLAGGDMLLAAAGGSDIGTLNVNNGRLLAISGGDFDNNTVVNVKSNLDFGVGGNFANQINLENGSLLENRSGGVSLTDVVMPTGTATVTLGADDVGGGSLTINGPTITLASGTTFTIVANAAEHYTEYTSTDVPPPVSTSDPNFNGVFNNSYVGQTPVHVEQQITGSGNLVITPEEAPVINYNVNPNGDVVGYRLGYGSPIYLDGANNYSGTTTVDGATVYVGASGFGTSTVSLNGSPFNPPYFDNVSQIELSGGTFANSITSVTGLNEINLVGGAPDETISGSIEMNTAGATLVIANSSSSNLSVGNIHFDADAGPDHHVNFDDYGSGAILLTGTYASDYVDPQAGNASSVLEFGLGGENGTYTLASTADFTGMQTQNVNGEGALDLWAGTLNIETDNFAGQTIVLQNNPGTNHTVNLVGALNLNTGFYVSIGDGAWTLNQSTANHSVYSGGFGLYDSTFDVAAVDGGRLDITGDVSGYSFDTFLTKTGAGTVVLGNPNGNGFNTQQAPNNNGVMADIQQGTLLVNNSQGYGMGARSGTINIEKGATLGGSGTLSGNQTVVSENAGSIIAPGDAGQASLGIKPTIGTLTIGRLTIASNADSTTDGLTMDFKLTPNLDGTTGAPVPGLDNDFLSAAYIALSGTVTINITDIGGIAVGTPYTLFEASGGLTGDPSDPTDPAYFTLNINTPAGYALDPDYGFFRGTEGYIFDTTGGTLTVQFIAVPEPSTYALMGFGLLALVAFRRVRKMHVKG